MKADVAFVACSKTKADVPLPAGALYASPLFRKSLQAALDHARKVVILSAKHGAIEPSERLAPYDTTLKRMPRAERRAWGDQVGASLASHAAPGSRVEVYCGEEYLAPIAPHMARLRYEITNRLEGMSLGQRLSQLAVLNGEASLARSRARFEKAIHRLWIAQSGGRLLSETSGRQAWPNRGVYFLLDAQVPAANGKIPRVIRVGTHAVSAGSKTTLWDRVSTHRGTTSGGGSHRSSIFRLHVGRALMARDPSLGASGGQSWGKGQSVPSQIRVAERQIEEAVSSTIGAMRLLWVDVPDAASSDSERAYIERNAIALLSRTGLLSAYGSKEWLGRHSPEWKIAASGLWNLNHVFSHVDSNFPDAFDRCVARTISAAQGQHSLDSSVPTGAIPNAQSQFALFSQDIDSRAAARQSDKTAQAIPAAHCAS